jgi:hypothetical protein
LHSSFLTLLPHHFKIYFHSVKPMCLCFVFF